MEVKDCQAKASLNLISPSFLDTTAKATTHPSTRMIKLLGSIPASAIVGILKSLSSARPRPLRSAEQLHSFLLKSGHAANPFLATALLPLYPPSSARQLFDEIPHPGLVPFTAMARAYSSADRPLDSLALFRTMLSHGLSPDPIALTIAVSASRQLRSFPTATTIHGLMLKSGTDVDPFLTTELIGSYGDSGELSSSRALFNETPSKTVVIRNAMIHQCITNGLLEMGYDLFAAMPERDVVSWNTMMLGLSRAGRHRDALELFRDMEVGGPRPNELTVCTALSACAGLGALATGMWVHAYIERKRMNLRGSMDHCIIDMYAKCGSIEKAIQVFQGDLARRDLYSWTSAICGLATHGRAGDALELFARMQGVGVRPDDITLVGVLNACAHGGLVDRATSFFRSMEREFGLSPKVEHYGCMVDLLGRMGRLKEAHELIQGMPMEPNAIIWGALLSACKVHNDVELGGTAAERLVELDPSDNWARVMMSNFYAEDRDWSRVTRVRKEMREEGTRKMPGCSSIEVNGEVHEFVAGGTLHSMDSEIRDMLGMVKAQMQLCL